jgi:hypothetical protein
MFPIRHEGTGEWILSSHFSILLLKVFGIKKTYIDGQCYIEVPFKRALGLLKMARRGSKAVDTYLEKHYPSGKPYYLTPDLCGWQKQEEAKWKVEHQSEQAH